MILFLAYLEHLLLLAIKLKHKKNFYGMKQILVLCFTS